MRLRCLACGKEHPEDASVCSCGGALDLEGFEPSLAREHFRGRGLARFRPALPLGGAELVTLGEGSTPLLEARALGARLKCEHLQPTGSFKDRGAAVLVSKARALGARRAVEDSSGNAGAAVAAYAARAGLPCDVFVPEWASEAKLRAIAALGAAVHRIPGPRRGVTEAALRFCAEEGAYFASHVYPPWFLEGTKTCAYELAEDLGFRAPDAVVAPAAMGTVLLGLRKGFEELRRAGLAGAVPRLCAAQASGFSPVVRALYGPAAGPEEENRLADGLLIAEPPRLPQIVDAVKGTGGEAVAVTRAETERAMARLHGLGFLVEPSSATALAALERLRAEGALASRDDVALVLTGRLK